jgi:hypothetical protein
MLVPVAAVLAGLAVGEFGARLALPDLDPSRQITFVGGSGDVPTLGPRNASLRLVKNTGDFNVAVHFNNQGFRDEKDVAQSLPADLVVVGDSFMMGWGVEQAARTSDRLAALLGRPVYNIAIPTGIDGFEELLDYSRRLGGRFGRVVMGVTMEMDVRVYPPRRAKAVPAPPPEPPGTFRLQNLKGWLRDNSTLYFLLTSQVHNNALLTDLAVRLGLLKPNLEGIHHSVFDEAAIASTANLIAEIGARYDLLVMIIPSRALWHGPSQAEEAHRHNALMAALKVRQVDVVDLRPVMEADGAPLSYYFLNDGHWRASGHDLASRALAERVRTRWPEAP